MSNLTTACPVILKSATEEAIRYFLVVCLAIIITVSIIGNSMVCIAFKVNEHLRTVSNYFIISLAVSDLITTIFVMPYDLDLILRSSWNHSQTLCQFYTTVYLVSAPASTLNLLAVSIDRFRLIHDPFAYKRTTTPFRAIIVIIVIWVYSSVTAFLPLMGWTESLPSNTSECVSICAFNISWDYSIMMSVLNFVIPPLVMTVIYFKIYQIARSHIRRIHRLESITGAANGMVHPSSRRSSSIHGIHSPIELETNRDGTHTYLTVPQSNLKIAHECPKNGRAIPNCAHERKDSAHAKTDFAHEKVDPEHTKMDPAHVNANYVYGSNKNVRASTEHVPANLDNADSKIDITRRGSNVRRKSRPYSVNGTSLLRKNVKAAKSLAIIVGTFFLCWYPHTISSMVLTACFRSGNTCWFPPRYVEQLWLTFGFLNSMVNPFLYALHNKEFKRTYKRILRWN